MKIEDFFGREVEFLYGNSEYKATAILHDANGHGMLFEIVSMKFPTASTISYGTGDFVFLHDMKFKVKSTKELKRDIKINTVIK